MKNIFLLYIPPGNHEAIVHYQDTIVQRVQPERIFRFVSADLRSTLMNIFGNRRMTVWGSRNSTANRSKYEQMRPGDDILIVEGDTIKLLGKVAARTINADLSRELWKNLKGNSTDGWDLIYFIANPLEIELPFTEFNALMGYAPNFQPRGFSIVAKDKLEDFYSRYDDLYSVLVLIKKGKEIQERDQEVVISEAEEGQIDSVVAAPEGEMEESAPSEHVSMQWKLIQLGKKCGSKVWIPRSNQQRIVKEFHFDEFEEEFVAGIDTPGKYIENIDVVWKDEFRIDAAFEIENTTSIYSGLLRFSDLKIVAPNSNYPLFIVAPVSRYNRLLEQIRRPTFKKLDFQQKVRYLSYEAVNDVDAFFSGSTTGLNVELLVGKSEEIR